MKLIFKPKKRKNTKRPIRLSFFKPVKLNTKQSVRKIPFESLTWPQASIRFPRMKPFGDRDKDGKLNMFDCKPFDKKRHGRSKLLMKEISEEVMGLKGLSTKYINKRGESLRRELKEKDPRKYAKHIGTTSKVVGPKDIVKALAKDPSLYSEYKKNKVRITSAGSDIDRLKSGNEIYTAMSFPADKNNNYNEVEYRSVMPLKHNITTTLKHELIHVKQPTHEMRAEQKLIEKQLKRKLEYEERPAELEAFEDENLPTERDIAKESGHKPETLQVLDLNDNQIPDTAEDVEIKPVETNEEEYED